MKEYIYEIVKLWKRLIFKYEQKLTTGLIRINLFSKNSIWGIPSMGIVSYSNASFVTKTSNVGNNTDFLRNRVYHRFENDELDAIWR